MKHPEDLTFDEYQFDMIQSTVRGLKYVPRDLVNVRDYIIEHIDEDITPKSVIEHFGLPFNHTRSNFTIIMGESISSMIRRLKQERAEKASQEEGSS